VFTFPRQALEELRVALEKPANPRGDEKTLEDVVGKWAREAGVRIDLAAVPEEKRRTEVRKPIPRRSQLVGLPLRKALKVLLLLQDLDDEIKDGVVVVKPVTTVGK
jgi:hypothetical protein